VYEISKIRDRLFCMKSISLKFVFVSVLKYRDVIQDSSEAANM